MRDSCSSPRPRRHSEPFSRSRSIACGESEMGLSTTFFPIHRVERVNEDETIGDARSLADIFETRVGTDVWTHLGLKRGLPAGAPEQEAMARSEWITLAEAESDYVERAVEDCGGEPGRGRRDSRPDGSGPRRQARRVIPLSK